MSQSQNGAKHRGLVGTIIFHVVVLMGFFLVSLTSPTSPDLMVSVELDYPNEMPSGSESENSSATTLSPPKVMTQNHVETVEVPAGNAEHPEVIGAPSPSSELLNAFANSENGHSNVGNEMGFEDSPDTGAHGDGEIELSGRSLLEKPELSDNSQEAGRVVVTIVVDRKGNVLRAVGGAKGSTTTSQHLIEIAEKAAMHAKFSPSTIAPEEQVGTMTFSFILK